MNGNQQAYDSAYQRSIDGKSSRSPWGLLTSLFEDAYTRQSRLNGERDGIAARVAAVGADNGGAPTVV